MKNSTIPTYVINLKNRTDRREHILQEFAGKPEFNVTLVEAVEHPIGSFGLWSTIRNIVQQASDLGLEKVLICEDDHHFTSAYSNQHLQEAISMAVDKQADVLCGGVSWFLDALPVNVSLYWANLFSGTQFIILFSNIFDKVLNSSFGDKDTADAKLCSFTDKVFFMYPFISVQRDFGYSDATPVNNGTERVEELFARTIGRLEILRRINDYYQQEPVALDEEEIDYDNISIPTYVINLPERLERRQHIEKQFEGKPEFDVTIVDACKHSLGAVGLWLSIRKIVQMAIDNDDDVIIICEDDHEFTADYSRNYLLKNILEADTQNADYLSGGHSSVNNAIAVSENRYWISFCQATQFIILYRSFFQKILDMPFDDEVIADLYLSAMTVNKMVLHPNISIQKDFGYSDVTPYHNEVQGTVQAMFKQTLKRLDSLKSSRANLTQW